MLLLLATVLCNFAAGFWTLYGITSSRLIIVHPSMLSSVIESYYPPDIDFIKKTRKKSGAGNLVFAAIREKSGKSCRTVEIGFFGVQNIDSVESMVLSLKNAKNCFGN